MTSELKCPYTEEELKEIRNNFKGDKLVCPFCQQGLRKLFNRYTGEPNYDYECGNHNCDLYGIKMPETVWQAVIQKLEDLKIAREALEKLNCEYHRCRDEEFEGADIDWEWWAMAAKNVAENALEQIEHKE